MRIASVNDAQKIDQLSQAAVPAELLMESAGVLAAQEIRAFVAREKINGRIAIVCGPGGNGGDGLVCARHLSSSGFDVAVYFFDSLSRHELFQANLKRLPLTIERRTANEVGELSSASLIVDALLGLGASRNVHGVMKLLIDEMNRARAPKVSLDIPSGLDADRGTCFGVAVKATLTLTFGLAKRGFFVNEGPEHLGRLKILPIGFPLDVVRSTATSQTAFGPREARRVLPKRKSSSNKASSGRTAVFAGRPGLIGAGLLAGFGATRVGSGYVTLVTKLKEKDKKARVEIARMAPEFLTLAFDDREAFEKTAQSAVVVGPGFGVGEDTLRILREFRSRKNPHVVVDADALTTLAQEKRAGHDLPLLKSWILTPHAGELARLLGGDAKALEANRFESCERAARELGAIVLFKGFRTVVSDGRRTAVVVSGNSALSKAGSGDILAGMIGGFLAQKVEPFAAACLAAYLHGRIADDWLKDGQDVLSLQPSDFLHLLPMLLKRLRTTS